MKRPSLDLRGPGALAQAGVVAGFMAAAILLGGSSAAGITANAVLQIAAIVALAAIAMQSWPTRLAATERQLLVFVALFTALYIIQLVPLPPGLWQALPGRSMVSGGLRALGLAPGWMPMSLAPAQTLHSGVALLPPVAMILLIARFQRPVARIAILAVLALMVVSVVLGVAQFSGSGAYLYANSNGGSATGFFPNANHFATFMCASVPLAAGLVARWRGGSDGEGGASRAFAIAVLLGVALLALLGVAMTKSVAGVMLVLLAIVGSAAIVLSGLPRGLRLGLLGVIVLVVLVAGAVVFTGVAGDFAISSLGGEDMSRPAMWRVTRHAIAAFGAVGTGFGSFQQVFHLFENPAKVTTTFANHAHNDLLEFVLEGGIPGVLLLLAFLGWFGLRLLRIWSGDGRRRDPLAQGASIAASIILLHSLVDYPLRTAAIATVFGLCVALMARGTSGGASEEAAAEAPRGRHLSA